MLHEPNICCQAIEQAAQAILMVDMDGRVTYQNQEARQMFGYDDEDWHGHSIFDKIDSPSVDGMGSLPEQSALQRAIKYGESARDVVVSMRRKDGSLLYASCNAAPVHVKSERIGVILFASDVTARQKNEEALRIAAEHVQLACEVAEVGFYDFCLQSQHLKWTDAVKKLFGLPPDLPVTVDTFFAVVHPDDRERIKSSLAEAYKADGDGRYRNEYRVIGLLDGKERWISSRGHVFFEDQKPVRHLGAIVEITERKQIELAMRQAGHHCPLTGLPNRLLLKEYTEHLFAMADRDQSNSAVLFVDLDRFKPVNDLHGHDTGDQVLKEVARRLRSHTRKEDIVSRLGGDEFVVVLPHVDAASDPWSVAQHILEAIELPIDIGGMQTNISASIGISLYPKHGRDLDTLLRCADLAMYSAKRHGRNNVQTYVPGQGERASDELQIEMHLRTAMDANRMTLFYQPIIDIATDQLIGVEALLRLAGANGHFVTPDKFIPIAESAGLIYKLGQWVTTEACRQHHAWIASGLPPLSISINISPVEFKHRGLVRHLAQAIETSGIDPSCLLVEVTESSIMDNVSEAISTLNELRSLGIRIALDDFGTGYSSLSYLSSLPLDKLKIDQSFIRKLDTSKTSKSITDTIIALGRAMNLQIVGEGIESAKSLDYLREQGCDQAQGYLYSKPLPAHEFESWYRARTNSLH